MSDFIREVKEPDLTIQLQCTESCDNVTAVHADISII